MRGPDELRQQLRAIDSRDYGAYRSLRGVVRFDGFDLDIDLVPKDPYAPPGTGVVRVRRPAADVGLRVGDRDTPAHRRATRDLLCRRFHRATEELCGGRRGTGWSGVITVGEPGQAILDRNAVVLDGDTVEVRVFVGFPGRGRRVAADVAETVLLEELPDIVAASLDLTSDRSDLDRHLATVDDAEALRGQLDDAGLVAFLADGAILPRRSGADDRPLEEGAVPLTAPDALRVTLQAPHAGAVTGLGIPTGVTVVVGGGYHGKSTLLSAIAAGVHDHVPGDGRERCVARHGAVPVRASTGRPVAGVDVSAFIQGLPDGRGTSAFSTTNASGSTSMAATIAEAMEVGADVLLVDEDTAATNLLVRDARMQRLVARGDEPITVLLDRVRELRDRFATSLVLVMGGAGDYLDVADTVLRLTAYRVEEVTSEARRIAEGLPTDRRPEAPEPMAPPRDRIVTPGSLTTANRYGKRSVRAVATDRILLGTGEVDLRDVTDQLGELAQTATLALALERFAERADGRATVAELVGQLAAEIAEGGLDVLDDRRRGTLAAVRAVDLAAALNRVRGLEVT